MAGWGPFDLEGKSAIVTGGAMGIGFGIATRMSEAGANVLIGDIDEGAAEIAAKKLGEQRGQVRAVKADVTDPTTGSQLADRCVQEFGSVDILVNNAGIYPVAPFLDLEPSLFDRILAVNLRGLMFTTQGVARRMVEQATGGAVINLGSMDGSHPSFPGLSAYGASKAAVIQVTKNMALELATHGIRVVAIAPGGIITEGALNTSASGNLTEEQRLALADMALAKIPLGRFGAADDIATVAVFLASPAARYMTGETVLVDGGILLS
jgi:NAD(P)-dependent dehydrogenase (short-subunit alcohol dehydrogenase family)